LTRIFVLMLMLATALQCAAQQQGTALADRRSSLTALDYQTGWIFLGLLTADKSRWAGGVGASDGIGFTGSFDLIERSVDPHLPTLPVVGEQIRLRTPSPVFILDFTHMGEQKRLEPPQGRIASNTGVTGVRLQAGTIIRVADVWVSPLYEDGDGGFRFAYARVVPK
jgi:hypothetical protein